MVPVGTDIEIPQSTLRNTRGGAVFCGEPYSRLLQSTPRYAAGWLETLCANLHGRRSED